MNEQQPRLRDALAVVRKRIQQIRERKEVLGEQNTKATLIDPVLSALGWDLYEIDEVRREYRRKPQDNPVDYALFLNRSECLLVEAKALEKDLSDRKWVSQNLAYATVVGVKWCVLTNGDEYRIYNAHAAVAVEEKLFRCVVLSRSDEAYLLETLHLLSKEQMRGSLLDVMWRAYFVDRNVRLALDSLVANEDMGLMRLIARETPGIPPSEVRASLKRAKISIDYPFLPAVNVLPTTSSIPAAPPEDAVTGGQTENAARCTVVDVRALIEAGVIRPPLLLEREYKGVRLTATIQSDGSIECVGMSFDSLSTAAGMARKTVVGAPAGREYPSTNGWEFWLYLDEVSGKRLPMSQARKLWNERNVS
jgi:hypothetical protein